MIQLPEPTLRRLPWYLAYLEILDARGVETVSSTRIAQALGVDSSQIAKDLSFLQVKGKTRIGYNVETLTSALSEFLGFKIEHKAFIVGAGNLGTALIHDKGLASYGLEIIAGFDVDPAKIGSESSGVKIYPISSMRNMREEHKVEIGILTVPTREAQAMADFMVAAGLKAVWNFTPYRIRVREGIVISNTSIYANLSLIYNRLHSINSTVE